MPNEDLKKKWLVFFAMLLDPVTSVLIGLYVILTILGCLNKDNSAVFYFIYIASTILAGFAGSRMYKLWSDYNEINVATTRGKVAIANLALLVQNILEYKEKTRKYTDSIEGNANISVIRVFLEEIYSMFGILQRESINAIENWSDIIPDANIKEKIADLNEKETSLIEKYAERNKLSEELSKVKEDAFQAKKDLEEEKKQKEKEINELNKKLNEAKSEISKSSVGGLFPNYKISIPNYTGIGLTESDKSIDLGNYIWNQQSNTIQKKQQ